AVLLFLFLAVGFNQVLAVDFTRFRGHDATGVADDHPNLPVQWSRTDNVAWVADVAGQGWGSPIVVGDRVFVTSVVADEPNIQPKGGLYLGQGVRDPAKGIHHWMVYCMDLQTGRELWRDEAHTGNPVVPRHPKSSYAAETPTTDGERLYVLFGDLGLYCYSLDGDLLWSHMIEPQKTNMDYGAAASPVVHDGQVFVVYDNKEESWIASFDAETGEQRWLTKRNEIMSWATPFVWQNSVRTEIVVPGQRVNRSYSLEGEELWSFDGNMSILVIPSPFAAHGMCYISSGYVGDAHRPTFAIRPGASGKIAADGEFNDSEFIEWYQPQASPYNTTQIVYGDYLYTVYDQGFMTCHNALTGEVVYGKKRFSPKGSFTASPWAYDGKIFCLNEDGLTYVIKAGPEFEILSTNSLDELCIATPSVVDGKLLIRTLTKLYCVTRSNEGSDSPDKANNESVEPTEQESPNGESTTAEASDDVLTSRGEQWQIIEMRIQSDGPIKNPFDVEFGAVMTHTDGDRIRVPGCYDGDGQWMIRFCPPKVGRWSFTVYSSAPRLSGRSGELNIQENQQAWQHGPIQIAKRNPRRFEYADGTPYFLMAFELDWLFALDAENDEDIPRTRELVSKVADNGFNQIVMNVYAYNAPWGEKTKMLPEHDFSKPNVFPFGGTNEKPDFSTLNVEFFQRLDRVIQLLNEKQIAAHLMIYVWNKEVNWPAPESDADNRFFDYVIRRYQAFPNIVWDISKEALDYGRDDMGYVTRRIDRLRRLDGHGRLLTVHDYRYCDAFPGKVDFISIQEWQPYLQPRMREVAARHSNKPVFNIEHGGYEKTTYSIFDGAYTNPETCLDRTYQCLFAGTYSTYYWQNTSWYNVISSPFSLPPENQPHFHYYKALTKLFNEFDFTELEPSQESFSPPILSNGKDTYLFYLPDYRTGINGRLPELLGKKMKIRWFDPLTGDYVHETEHLFADDTWLWMKRPKEISGSAAIAVFTLVDEK
ncbi:MAG: DUF4038 domain-containing protein, partial [Planctomycetota bacterium]